MALNIVGCAIVLYTTGAFGIGAVFVEKDIGVKK